jgi:hypothetical protein
MELKYRTWKDITVNKFLELERIKNSYEKTGDDDLDAINRAVAILQVVCDASEDEILDLPKNVFSELLAATNFLMEMPKAKITDKYVINGKKYNVFLEMNNMTVSQYIDFQTFYKDQDKYTKEMIACFLIPEGKKYGEYDINEVINDIGNHMSIVDAYSILFFFTILSMSLTKVTLNCSIKDMRKMMKKEKNEEQKMMMEMAIMEMEKALHSLKNGGGYIL